MRRRKKTSSRAEIIDCVYTHTYADYIYNMYGGGVVLKEQREKKKEGMPI